MKVTGAHLQADEKPEPSRGLARRRLRARRQQDGSRPTASRHRLLLRRDERGRDARVPHSRHGLTLTVKFHYAK